MREVTIEKVESRLRDTKEAPLSCGTLRLILLWTKMAITGSLRNIKLYRSYLNQNVSV